MYYDSTLVIFNFARLPLKDKEKVSEESEVLEFIPKESKTLLGNKRKGVITCGISQMTP
jgi:hypothetical protein